MTIEFRELDAVSKIEAAKEHNVRFVQLQFTDILGIVKAVTIPLHQGVNLLQLRVLGPRPGVWFAADTDTLRLVVP